MLVTDILPSPIGGISEQPPNIRTTQQVTDMVNFDPDPVTGCTTRQGSALATLLTRDRLPTKNAFHMIDRGATEKYLMTVYTANPAQPVTVPPSKMRVWGMDGTEYPVVSNDVDCITYLTSYNPDSELKFLTLADSTYISNSKVKVAMDYHNEDSASYRDILVVMKQVAYDTKYYVTIDNTEFALQTPKDDATQPKAYVNGTQVTWSNPDATINPVSVEGVLRFFYDQIPLTLTWMSKDVYIKKKGNCLMFMGFPTGHENFEVFCRDSRQSLTTFYTVHDRVQRFADLPGYALNNMLIKVLDGGEYEGSYYYVRFNRDEEGSFSRGNSGTWEESKTYGGALFDISHDFDLRTMPIRVDRKQASQYITARNPYGIYFEVVKPDWVSRAVGDPDTSPPPSFVGTYITGLFVYRGRLGFLTPGTVVLSCTNDYENFWRHTLQEVTDDDPIDVSSSHPRLLSMNHATPFNGDLLIFGDRSQFVLSGQETLTPRNVNMSLFSEFECSPRIGPVVAEGGIYWAYPQGGHSGIREFMQKDDTSQQNLVTKIVPTMIKGELDWLSACPTMNYLVASPKVGMTGSAGDGSIYVYRFVYSGGQKMQSAWTRWKVPGEVLWHSFINSKLYIVSRLTGGPANDQYWGVLSVLDLDDTSDTGLDFRVRMDLRMDTSVPLYDSAGLLITPTGSYSAGMNTTTFTLPIWLKDPVAYDMTTQAEIPINTTPGSTLTAFGNWTNRRVMFGERLRGSVEFSRFYIHDENGSGTGIGMSEGLLMIKWLILNINGQGDATVTFRRQSRADEVRPIPKTSDDSTRVSRWVVGEKNTEFYMTVGCSGVKPMTILSTEWVGDWLPKARRL